jgi:DNA-binding LacI/PurR family transcriptional regulator
MADAPGAGKRPTQAEIARIAGVSQATVSLVLNGRDDALSAETRARVRAAIERWGYVANPIARVLAGGRNRLLGIHTFERVFPLDGADFYFPFLLGVEEEAERHGYDLLMFTSGGEQRRIFQGGTTRLRLADGALLLGRRPDIEEIERIADLDYPFVYIGRREIPGRKISYVAADYTAATDAVTTRLLDGGHRQLAYLRLGEDTGQPSQDRLEGFRAAVRRASLGGAASPVWDVPSLDDLGPLLDDCIRAGVTALLVEQRQLAERLLIAGRARGLSIPEDLSVAVLGDTIGVTQPGSDWSGFHVPRQEMGVAAARVLIGQLEGTVGLPHVETVACRPVDGSTIAPAVPGRAPLPAR